ncbi:ABC transporter ATP-binding protein [Aquimarina agarivorans]|uniref:ABC transporter ATP-binding protein n=1 Tax=Aquimarina agarivorans TaxID=980584 RepID=UPI000248E9D6|nr:ABC transporter ATP-binding protein [Aquimarina agarivorans]
MAAHIELRNVSKSYGEGDDRVEVLRNINLVIEEGEFVAIVGFSGSGKTTLIKLISGLEFPDEGEVLYKGAPVTGPSLDRGVIFQNYSLLPWLNVRNNVGMAVKEKFKKWTKSQVGSHVEKYVDMVSLSHAINKLPKALSGGMRQRVSVTRALSLSPDVILMDEPLSALDALTRGTLQDEILNIWSKDKKTALLITNDVDEGIYMADRIIPLRPGPKATLGPIFEVNIERPRDKTELNNNDNFKKLRNSILEYLIKIGSERAAKLTNEYTLPDLKPIPKGRLFQGTRA